MAILDTIKKAKHKVIDVTSDAISFPARRKANKEIAKSTQNVNDIKMVRKAKGVQDGGDYRDPLFRARANVSNMSFEQEYAARRSGKPSRY
jgi:hypothetical protein